MRARRAASVTARYMAPVSRNRKPRRTARARAALLFPDPAGPSMVMIIVSALAGLSALIENVGIPGAGGKGQAPKNPTPHPPPRSGEGEKDFLLPLSAPGRGVGGWGNEVREAVTAPYAVRSIDDREDIVLGHDEVLLAVDCHLVAGVGAEQHAVALLDLERGALAVLHQLAITQADHLALPRFLLGRVGQDDPAGRLLLGLQTLDHDLVVQWYDPHAAILSLRINPLPSPGRTLRNSFLVGQTFLSALSARQTGMSAPPGSPLRLFLFPAAARRFSVVTHQGPGDRVQDDALADRLVQDAVGVGLARLADQADAGISGHQDARQHRVDLVHQAQRLQPRHPRQVHVQKRQVDRRLADDIDRLLARGR